MDQGEILGGLFCKFRLLLLVELDVLVLVGILEFMEFEEVVALIGDCLFVELVEVFNFIEIDVVVDFLQQIFEDKQLEILEVMFDVIEVSKLFQY